MVGCDALGLKHWSLMLWQLQDTQLPVGSEQLCVAWGSPEVGEF